MNFETYVSWISNPVQIAFIDLVLGADNAVIIALVCSTLPRRQRLNVLIVGTGAAMLLRLFLTAVAGALMSAPVLRLIGGLVLMLIAVGLVDEVGAFGSKSGDDDGPEDFADPQAATEAFWDAILLVALADGVMSFDNTVALAAVAKGDILFLVLGLALSVPMLVFGSWLLSELFGSTPWFLRAAMAVLGWVAGDMAVSDPLITGWIHSEAPALAYAVPIAAVVFVLGQGAIYRRRLRREAALHPPAASRPVASTLRPVDEPGGGGIAPKEARELLSSLAGIDGVAPAASGRADEAPLSEQMVAAAARGSGPALAGTGPDVPSADQVDGASRDRLSAADPVAAAVVEVEPSDVTVERPVEAAAEVAVEPQPLPPAGAAKPSAAAATEAPAAMSGRNQQGEDKMMFVGLFILFAVAAVLISGAIIVGGATF